MKSFQFNKRIYYHDTDCGNVVYYANYLKHLEEARTEHLRSLGIDLKKLAGEGVVFAVASLSAAYKSPARYADEIACLSEISAMGKAYIDFRHEIRRGGTVLVECDTRLVCLGREFKPTAIPAHIRGLLPG